MDAGLFTSFTDEWETPKELFDELNQIFKFRLDVCANKLNYKVKKYYTRAENGLHQKWSKVNWMNPPYGREIKKWLERACEEGKKKNCTVCLIPARTDTKWWHNYVMKADIIYFIKGRLKFSNTENSAPFPSAIVIFGLFNFKGEKKK